MTFKKDMEQQRDRNGQKIHSSLRIALLISKTWIPSQTPTFLQSKPKEMSSCSPFYQFSLKLLLLPFIPSILGWQWVAERKHHDSLSFHSLLHSSLKLHDFVTAIDPNRLLQGQWRGCENKRVQKLQAGTTVHSHLTNSCAKCSVTCNSWLKLRWNMHSGYVTVEGNQKEKPMLVSTKTNVLIS